MMVKHPSNYRKLGCIEVDSCADTCCAGATFWLIADTGLHSQCQKASMETWGNWKVSPLAHITLQFDYLVLQETIVGIFHQCLYLGVRWKSH